MFATAWAIAHSDQSPSNGKVISCSLSFVDDVLYALCSAQIALSASQIIWTEEVSFSNANVCITLFSFHSGCRYH